MHCNTDFGKIHSPQLRAALQSRLTAALFHCNCTYEDLLFIRVCRSACADTVVCLNPYKQPRQKIALQSRQALLSAVHCNAEGTDWWPVCMHHLHALHAMLS